MTDTARDAEEAILSDLAHKLVDQVALYGLAKGIAQDPAVVDAIQKAKDARARLLLDINAKLFVQDIGPIDQGTKLGTAEGAFARLRAISGKDDRVAIAEVARGEDYLYDRISAAAHDERLTAHTSNYLQTVCSRVEATRDEIKQVLATVQATR